MVKGGGLERALRCFRRRPWSTASCMLHLGVATGTIGGGQLAGRRGDAGGALACGEAAPDR
jgi:hypothetical protein